MREINIINLGLNLLIFYTLYHIRNYSETKMRLGILKENMLKYNIKKIVISISGFVYILFTILIYTIIKNPLASILISFLPSIIPYIIYDVIYQYNMEKEQKQVTMLVALLSKWSLVKNDLIFCIKKVGESDIKNPIRKLMSETYIRINSGMSTEKALHQLEKEAFGDNLKYLVKNIKFSAKKGGNLVTLFKNAEEQYFKIDEELFKRKISSYRDQITIYVVMVFVLLIGVWFISRDSSVYMFYLQTSLGQNLIGVFCVMYCLGVVLTVKK